MSQTKKKKINNSKTKKDPAVIANPKVDVPQKQEGGEPSGHGELRADHLLGY